MCGGKTWALVQIKLCQLPVIHSFNAFPSEDNMLRVLKKLESKVNG